VDRQLWIPIIIALIAAIPGSLAIILSQRQAAANLLAQQNQARQMEDVESRKVDAEALERAKRFYSALFDEMEEALKQVRDELLATRVELAEERKERIRLARQLQLAINQIKTLRSLMENAGLTLPPLQGLDLSIPDAWRP